MIIYPLFVGDDQGLRNSTDKVERAKVVKPAKAYSGPTGFPAVPDQDFVDEVVRRRSALCVSAIKLSKAAGYSGAYLAMVENGSRFASDKAKEAFRLTLDRLESEKK